MFTANHFIYWLVHQLVRCLVDHFGYFDQVTLFISTFPSSVALNTAIFSHILVSLLYKYRDHEYRDAVI